MLLLLLLLAGTLMVKDKSHVLLEEGDTQQVLGRRVAHEGLSNSRSETC